MMRTPDGGTFFGTGDTAVRLLNFASPGVRARIWQKEQKYPYYKG